MDGKRIAFLGDSITCGACLRKGEESYVDRITKSCPRAKVFRYGEPGSRIGSYIGEDPRKIGPSFVERFRRMDKELDIVVVFGGTNDYGIGNAPLGTMAERTPETFCGAWNLLAEGLLAIYPRSRLLFVTPLHRRGEEMPNAFSGAVFSDYVDVIRTAAKRHGADLLDLYAAASLQPNAHYYSTLILEDGIHPGAKGHRVIAGEFLAYLYPNT